MVLPDRGCTCFADRAGKKDPRDRKKTRRRYRKAWGNSEKNEYGWAIIFKKILIN